MDINNSLKPDTASVLQKTEVKQVEKEPKETKVEVPELKKKVEHAILDPESYNLLDKVNKK